MEFAKIAKTIMTNKVGRKENIMKTIRELKSEGLISARLYHALIRGITFDGKFDVIHKRCGWKEIDHPNGNELTVKDILELWSDEEILRWRGLGKKALKELKGLA